MPGMCNDYRAQIDGGRLREDLAQPGLPLLLPVPDVARSMALIESSGIGCDAFAFKIVGGTTTGRRLT